MSLGILGRFCPALPSGAFEEVACAVSRLEIPILVAGILLLGTGIWFHRRFRGEREEMPPILVFPLRGSGPGAVHPPARDPPPPPSEAPEAAPPRPPPRKKPPTGPDPARRMILPTGAAGDPGPEARGSEGNGVHYLRPPDGTLQLLPGRLEVVSGPGIGQEIRFVRVPGAPPEITFGREDGPEYRHVRLGSPTVSRRQAHLTFHDGGWTLRNGSSTNPTKVNGSALSSEVEAVRLTDGDHIEMGEIGFRFRHEATKDRLPFRSSWHTDVGRRATNQDAVVVKALPDGRELAAVCDGMGSHHAGGVASHRALESLVSSLSDGAGLEAAVRQANAAVLEAARENPEREGMATTLVALLREGDRYHIANVGDSRAYRIVPDGIEQITRDHSFAADALQAGAMTPAEIEGSPWRNAVTRSLGASDDLTVDLYEDQDARRDHVVVLCTDGVHGILTAEEIEAVCRETPGIRELARSLSERALVKGGEDNVAVAAIAFGAAAPSKGRAG